MTTLGGKTGRSPASWSLLKTDKAFLEEPLAPLADDLSRSIEPGSDFIIVQTFGSVEDYPGTDNISIR
jgi:hypothetical protein